MPRLEIRSVVFTYDDAAVLDDVDMHVEAGEVVAVVGPNGAGKTTLLRVASGLLEPTRGSVLLDGDVVHDLPRRLAARRIMDTLN